MSQKSSTTKQHRLTQVQGNILLGERGKDFIDCHLADVYQHAGSRKLPHRLYLIPRCLRNNSVQRISTVVFFQHLPVSYGRHPLIVEFEPPALSLWFDESKVPSTVEVARVYEHAMKLVLPGFSPISRLVEELVKVDFEGEFEGIIDLRGGGGGLGSNR